MKNIVLITLDSGSIIIAFVSAVLTIVATVFLLKNNDKKKNKKRISRL
jgi:hypothetical protein